MKLNKINDLYLNQFESLNAISRKLQQISVKRIYITVRR